MCVRNNISNKDFVYLHNHSAKGSNLRLLDSINKIEDMILYCNELGTTAMALTDHEAVCGHIDFLNITKKLKEQNKINPNFKPILGNEIYLVDEEQMKYEMKELGRTTFYHFILLAKDNIGHEQIRELSSKAWIREFNYKGIERVPTFYTDIEDVIGKNKGHLIFSSACFLQGNQIKTDQGYKNIEDIQMRDKVLTIDNTYQTVQYPTTRHYYGNIVTINFQKAITNKITCTEDHQFAVLNNNQIRWKKAGNLNNKDICLSPVQTTYTYLKKLNIKKYKEEYCNKYSSIHMIKKNIPNEIILSDDFFRMFGLFLADGCLRFNKNNKTLGFAFNEKEFKYFFPFVQKGLKQFNLTSYVRQVPQQHKVEVTYSSSLLTYVFYKIFNNTEIRGNNKRVPEIFKNISPQASINILYGYLLGDGYFRTRKAGGEVVSASISKTLSIDMIDLFRQFNCNPSLRIEKAHIGKDKTPHKESFYVCLSSTQVARQLSKNQILSTDKLLQIFTDGGKSYKNDFIVINNVKYIKKYIYNININKNIDTEVFCLNINKNHNFICEDVIVHNCLGGQLPHLILALLQTDNEQQKELIKDKINDFINWCVSMCDKGDFYIELQPSLQEEQIAVNKMAIKIAKAYGLKWIISTDSHYLKEEDRPIHAAYLTSDKDGNGNREVDAFYSTTYFLTVEEIINNMSYLPKEDIINGIITTKEIENKIIGYNFDKVQKIPLTPIPNKKNWYKNDNLYNIAKQYKYINEMITNNESYDKYMINMVLSKIPEKIVKEDYKETFERIDLECQQILGVSKVRKQPISAYFTTMKKNIDIIWQKANALIMPGRGSAGAYMINFLLGITQLNPLKQGVELPYFRFIHQSKPEMPDCA